MPRFHTPHLVLKASTESVPLSPMRWLHCGQRTALVLLFLLSNDRRLFPLVAATFRGAKPKAIPSLSKDGHIVEEQSTGSQQQVILEKVAPGKGVRRMKGGMMPWWVRKRLQEKGSPRDASALSSTNSLRLYQSGSRSKAKTLNKDVQVVLLAANDREEDAAGGSDGAPETVGAESAIVIEDLPLEDGEGEEDNRAAAYQDEIASMADKAKAEELARGSQADPDLLAAGANAGTADAGGAARDLLPDIMGGGMPEGRLEKEGADVEAVQQGRPRGPAGGRDKAQAAAAALFSRGQPDEVLVFEEEEEQQASSAGGSGAPGAATDPKRPAAAAQSRASRRKRAGEKKTRLGMRSAVRGGGKGKPAARGTGKGSVVSALNAARREEAASGVGVARVLLSWPARKSSFRPGPVEFGVQMV